MILASTVPAQSESKEASRQAEDFKKVQSSPEFQIQKQQMEQMIQEIDINPELLARKLQVERQAKGVETTPEFRRKKAVMEAQLKKDPKAKAAAATSPAAK